MICSPTTRLVLISITCMAFVALSYLPVQAQTYPYEMNSPLHGYAGATDPLTQYSYSGTRLDSTLEFLKRKNEEAQERRDLRDRERQRRTQEREAFTTPSQELLESHFSRSRLYSK